MAMDSSTLPLATHRTPQNHAQPALRITVCAGPDAGSVGTAGQQAVVGRGQTADIKLSDASISQFHAELRVTQQGISVMDLNSTNGTWLGGVRLERATIPAGTLLSIGQTVLRVDLARFSEEKAEPPSGFDKLVGSSPAMRSLYLLLARLARTDLSVVLQGETGTGKEEVARALHRQSARCQGPFVVLDCGALPETLAESILFGHERGAFTGAYDRRIGLFESAHGGVLFMDEIGELPLSLQPLLLRALQQREITPLGSTRPRRFDVRIICATWRELRALVNQGRFREDLFYRIAQSVVQIPSLTERREDISLLVEHFLRSLPRGAPAARSFSEGALALLAERPFPGNVRELRNIVERAALLAEASVVSAADLEIERAITGLRTRDSAHVHDYEEAKPAQSPVGSLDLFKEAKQTAIEAFERAYLERLLRQAGRNLTRAAAFAGLERHNLRALLRKHGLYGSD